MTRTSSRGSFVKNKVKKFEKKKKKNSQRVLNIMSLAVIVQKACKQMKSSLSRFGYAILVILKSVFIIPFTFTRKIIF